MKRIFIVTILCLMHTIKFANANSSQLFNYSQTETDLKLEAATAAEFEYNNNLLSSSIIKEKYNLKSLFNYNYKSQSVPDLGYVSFVAGCCVGLPGLAVVSLQYYNQSGGSSSNGSYGTASIGAFLFAAAIIGAYFFAVELGII